MHMIGRDFALPWFWHRSQRRRGRRWLTGATALTTGLVLVLSALPANALAPTTPDSAMWQVNGRVRVILETPNAIYLGGNFTSLLGPGGQSVARTYLAALNPATGAPLPFNPNLNKQVWDVALSSDGTTLYTGGDFSRAGNTTRQRAAAFDATSGALRAWNPNVDATAEAVAVIGNTVYLGGEFLRVGGTPRARLVAVDATSGAIRTGWGATADDTVHDIMASPAGDRVFVAGHFQTISGSPGPSQRRLSVLNPTTGVPMAWASHPTVELTTLAMSGTQLFAGGRGAGGHAYAYNLATGQQQWATQGDGDATGLAYQNGVLYIGGHFNQWNGAARHHILAVQPTTGVPLTWPVEVNSNLGIFSMYSFQGHLSIGGDFTKVNNIARQRYARFSEAVDITPPTPPGKPVVGTVTSTTAPLSWAASTDNSGNSLVYTVYRNGDPSSVGQVTSASQGTISFTDTSLNPGGTYSWTVRASDGLNLSDPSEASDQVTLPPSPNPLLNTMQMFDNDEDGRVDQVVATFSSNVTCTGACTAPWTLSNVPSNGTLGSVSVSGNTATLNLNEGGGAQNTAVGTFRVALAASPTGVVDADGDAASFATTAPADRAGPVPTDITSTPGTINNVMQVGDTFTATFSEALDPSTVPATGNVKQYDPSGPGTDRIVIVGIVDTDMDLLDDNIVIPDDGTIGYNESVLSLLNGNTRLRTTVTGSCSGTACGQNGVGSDQNITLRPEPVLRDIAGNGAVGSHTELEGIF
jgi:hypothetical protein